MLWGLRFLRMKVGDGDRDGVWLGYMEIVVWGVSKVRGRTMLSKATVVA